VPARHWFAIVIALVFTFTLAGCTNATPKNLKPMVTVVTPVDGARYEPGETVNLTIAAAASQNVARVELSRDGSVVATQVNPRPSPTFSTRIAYIPPGQGRIQLEVIAVDGAGASSDPFRVVLQIGDDPTPTPAPTPASEVVVTPAGVIGPNGCLLLASFLQDVNVPDGAEIQRGATFDKTWRMKNTSSCDWGEGYTLAYDSDTPLGAQGSAPVRPTPSNAMVDITVPMIAPNEPGVYTSTWRMKDPTGQPFGNRVFVVIRVP
jgi:hypothetical protein